MTQVQVIATGSGYYGLNLRQPGDVFTVDAQVFDKRPKFDADGKPTGKFYDKPTWFVKAVERPAPTKVLVPEEDEALTAAEQARVEAAIAAAAEQARVEARAAFMSGKATGSDLA